MRTYTTREAAAAAGCAPSTVARLKQKGVLEGGRGFVKAPNQQVLVEVVDQATRGRHGWKWRPRRQAAWPETRTEVKAFAASLAQTATINQPQGDRRHETIIALTQWIGLSEDRRYLLMGLSNRFTDEELRLLSEL